MLSAVTEGLKSYCDKVCSRCNINQMLILRTSKDFLDNFNVRTFSKISSIETFDFSTLYTTIPHETLKTLLKEVIHNAFTLNLAGNVVRL